MIEFAKVLALEAGTRVRTLLAQLRATGTTGQDDDAEPMDGVEVVQPHGLAARPEATSTLEAVYVRSGDEFVCIGLLDKGSAALSPALEERETRVYSLAGSYLRCRADGSMDLVTAGGKAIRLGAAGGTADKPVAHEGSGTTGHTHTFTLNAGPYTVTGTINSATDSIATGQGSANVLVPDT